MKRFALVLSVGALVCAWLLTPGSAQERPAAPELKSIEQKVSYSLGYRLGVSFGEGLDKDLLLKGLADALAKRQAPITEQEMMQAMNDFQQQRAAREADENLKTGQAFLEKNKAREGVTTLPSGLQYEVLKRGDGPSPAATDTVKVHYHGTLTDGQVFDSSVERGEPVSFPLNRVIKGWTEGLQLMKVGGKWKFFIPSDLAYGPQRRSDKIGPNAVLVFEVELLGIEGK